MSLPLRGIVYKKRCIEISATEAIGLWSWKRDLKESRELRAESWGRAPACSHRPLPGRREIRGAEHRAEVVSRDREP